MDGRIAASGILADHFQAVKQEARSMKQTVPCFMTCLLPTSPSSAALYDLPPYIWQISLVKPLYVAAQKRCG
jgi:hypothetical protein